ncbi:glutamate decarboxylase [Sugiyamaella lignohabitans]|uniref:Glutamate decarboxylase n=1 Tax=Sugiyamaella lignohabitans TaxID=796027 RepID=A0A167DFG4_9ASCO|nr:glutamate decarboxylase [Sugiyamaella lignohabitans]ANB12859.1 glutamate decarboxylase [Sugiyamaella lignohabitans]
MTATISPSSRADELELVLESLTKTFVEYVRVADSPSGTIGSSADPKALATSVNISIPEEGQGIEGLLKNVDTVLDNSVVTWHNGFLDKLYASNNSVGVAGDLLLSMLNTNVHVFTVSPALTLIEKRTGHEYAKLFGFTGSRSGGLTFPGGSYSNIHSLHIARSILFPDTKTEGNGNHKFAVYASNHCHYSVEKAAILCGLGSRSLFKVNTRPDGTMDTDHLEQLIQKTIQDGYTPLYINGTAGTTVYGSFDDFNAIADISEKYKTWFHIDGSWGGNVIFSSKQNYKLKGSHRANSITVNPHKMLGVPCTCSFLLVPDEATFQQANSLQAPYLFHNSHDGDDNFDLADGTMGCGRRSDALKMYLAWNWYGTKGFGERIDHSFSVTEYLARKVHESDKFTLISDLPPPCLQTCFYFNHPSTQFKSISEKAEENSNHTRQIVSQLFKRGKFLVDYSPHSSGTGEFFRVVVNSPK